MYILEKIDHILGKVYESEVLSWEDVQNLCPKAVSLANKTGKALYRGSKDYQNEYGKALIRTDRKPLSTSKELHDKLDVAFNQVFGVKLRSGSLFCTGYSSQASRYGKLYEIYPSDDFKLYWSSDISDLYNINSYFPDSAHEFFKNANPNNFDKAAWLALQVKFKIFSPNWLEGSANWLVTNCWDFMKLYYPNIESHKKSLEDNVWIYWDNEKAEDDFSKFERDLTNNWKCRDDFIKAALKNSRNLKSFENAERDALINFVKEYYKCGNSESAWKEAIASENEIMVTASFYCYKEVK